MMGFLRNRALFTLILWLFVLAVILASPTLGRVARFVPLLVAIPTLLLLSIQLIVDLFPTLRQVFARVEQTCWPLVSREQSPPSCSSPTPGSERTRSQARLVWTLALPLLVYGLGFMVAVPLHAFVYLRLLSGERWTLALSIPAALCGLLILCARLLPAIPLWPGRLWPLLGLG